MRYLLQALAALVALVGLPLVLDAPESTAGHVAAVVVALILVGLAFRGVVGYVNSRRPKVYLDSVMPDKHIDVEKTAIRPPRRKA